MLLWIRRYCIVSRIVLVEKYGMRAKNGNFSTSDNDCVVPFAVVFFLLCEPSPSNQTTKCYLGAGKSTLINMIIGKDKPDSGSINIGKTVSSNASFSRS